MTPECPKGPERGARPDLSQTVFEALWKAFEDEGGRLAPGTADRLTEAALKPISSELERLTAEVERLTEIVRAAEYVEGPADCFEQECDDFTNEAGELVELPANCCSHMTVRYATADDADAAKWCPEMIRSLEEEVSRLREQLAAQQQTAATSATAHKVGIRETGGGYRVDCETCGAWALFADMNADRAEDWKEEHEAPSRPLVHSVLLSSDTGVMGEWQAFCSGCRQRSVGDLAHAEFWKDQHLADVLVPQALGECAATLPPAVSSQEEKKEGETDGR